MSDAINGVNGVSFVAPKVSSKQPPVTPQNVPLTKEAQDLLDSELNIPVRAQSIQAFLAYPNNTIEDYLNLDEGTRQEMASNPGFLRHQEELLNSFQSIASQQSAILGNNESTPLEGNAFFEDARANGFNPKGDGLCFDTCIAFLVLDQLRNADDHLVGAMFNELQSVGWSPPISDGSVMSANEFRDILQVNCTREFVHLFSENVVRPICHAAVTEKVGSDPTYQNLLIESLILDGEVDDLNANNRFLDFIHGIRPSDSSINQTKHIPYTIDPSAADTLLRAVGLGNIPITGRQARLLDDQHIIQDESAVVVSTPLLPESLFQNAGWGLCLEGIQGVGQHYSLYPNEPLA